MASATARAACTAKRSEHPSDSVCLAGPGWEQFTLRLVPDAGLVGTVPEQLRVEVSGTQVWPCLSAQASKLHSSHHVPTAL